MFRIVDQPYEGQFNLPEQMRFKERLLASIDADWFLHNDADEIRHAPKRFANLREGIAHWDRQGFNAIEFDEFIFLPTTDEDRLERRDFVAGMRHYYFFKPQALHRLNAWKNTGVYVDLHTHFGHRAEFEGRRIAPEPFIMRHYIVLSRAHALAKYCARVHSETEIRTFGWKDERVGFRPERLKFPGEGTAQIPGAGRGVRHVRPMVGPDVHRRQGDQENRRSANIGGGVGGGGNTGGSIRAETGRRPRYRRCP